MIFRNYSIFLSLIINRNLIWTTIPINSFKLKQNVQKVFICFYSVIYYIYKHKFSITCLLNLFFILSQILENVGVEMEKSISKKVCTSQTKSPKTLNL